MADCRDQRKGNEAMKLRRTNCITFMCCALLGCTDPSPRRRVRNNAAASDAAPGKGRSPDEIPYRTALSQADVTLTEMKDGRLEGLVIGNGDLYGLVWDREGELFLRMTKNDIWDARVDTSKDGPLPKVDIGAGKVTGKRGGQSSWKDHVYPCASCMTAMCCWCEVRTR
jgi:hypothetical protein